MKYNILTVSNQDYFPFLELFIKSLYQNADSENLLNVYIFDTGLNEESKSFLSEFNKNIIVDTGQKTEHKKLHDPDWCLNTYSKMDYLYQVIEKTKIPSFMIDVDSVFQKSFESIINPFADIVACYRPKNQISTHIGSFFGGIDYLKTMIFIQIWKQNLDTITEFKHKESPALSKVINTFQGFKIQHLYERDISCVEENEEAFIYHLKSDGFAQTISERINLNYSKKIIKCIK
tara:strand:- start:1942 stop:2640 length:699 start_codon:yes stop_codon:yes gene_type:complete